jgi:ATP-dependent Clp endopeptidase proteolytic subunit ClpP
MPRQLTVKDVHAEVERRVLAAAPPLESVPRNAGVPLVRAQAEGSAAVDVFLYDFIGGWFGLTAAQLVAELQPHQGRALRVHINSPGGDVFDGLAIYNTLVQWAGEVETVIEGLAGSIAGVIALAGSPVSMAPASFFMIHEPEGAAAGNAARMRRLAALLDKSTGVLAEVYRGKSGAPLMDVRAWMAAETWYTAEEARAAGFVDAVLDAEPEAVAAAVSFDLSAFAHVPAALAAPRRAERPKPPPPVPPGPPAPVPSALAAPVRERFAALARSLNYLVGA